MIIIGKNSKEKPLLNLLRKMPKESPINFSRLTLEDLPEVNKLLMSVWPKYYGKTGCPVYSDEYLRWVLGGPNSNRHILFGGRINDELVAYQSFLFRKISYCGEELAAYLGTHLAISAQLDFRLRLYCLAQTLIFYENSIFYDDTCEIVYEIHEERKTLRDIGGKYLRDYSQIETKICSIFNQFVVTPNKLRRYLHEKDIGGKKIHVRPAYEEDSFAITEVFNRIPEGPHFVRLMAEDELRHHFFGHPAHRTFVIEAQGAILAFINFYPLEMIKEGKNYGYVVIEFLISGNENIEYIALLLNEAVNFAEEIGAKGIVFENASYLEYDAYRPLGVIPTFRKMTMSVISKRKIMDYIGGFRCDIK
jgi:hypothetical protein